MRLLLFCESTEDWKILLCITLESRVIASGVGVIKVVGSVGLATEATKKLFCRNPCSTTKIQLHLIPRLEKSFILEMS